VSGTLVSFHAHPDDETIQTGGTIARAAAGGHRVVLVFATRGENGEVDDGFLRDGETLAERRVAETEAAASVLGASRVAFLGYTDSGMAGTPENDVAGSFWQADAEEAASRLAAILLEEDAEVLTVYDDHGGYDHPDHIQVHRVGIRAAELANTPHVYEATMNRDEIKRFMVELSGAAEHGVTAREELGDPEELTMGMPAEMITTSVDVSEFVDTKRKALTEHRSQVDETSFFLAMPEEHFRLAFGTEWFIRRGAPAGVTEDWIFPTS
jgi:LmbE family N-acetylglucosaminyl deacetylase